MSPISLPVSMWQVSHLPSLEPLFLFFSQKGLACVLLLNLCIHRALFLCQHLDDIIPKMWKNTKPDYFKRLHMRFSVTWYAQLPMFTPPENHASHLVSRSALWLESSFVALVLCFIFLPWSHTKSWSLRGLFCHIFWFILWLLQILGTKYWRDLILWIRK
jgi:hypothetical protein